MNGTIRTRRPGAGARSGFTLTEILVVIGIIVILISILIPVVSKVRKSAQVADVQSQISQLTGAIESYQRDHSAYPGPIANANIYATAVAPNIVEDLAGNPINANVTMAENLVLGLLGGLNNVAGVITFDWQLVGKGAKSLNAANPKTFPTYLEAKDLSWDDGQPSNSAGGPGATTGFYGDDSYPNRVTLGTQRDSVVPEIVDRFPSGMPILYLRAVKGAGGATPPTVADNPVITYDPTPTTLGQYQLRQIIAYTGSETEPAGTGPSIGAGKDVPDYYVAGAKVTAPQPARHGLRTVTPLADLTTDKPGGTAYTYPRDAFTYFASPSAPAATPTARQKDSFILISAGLDRVYGTTDDITSFGAVD